MKPITKDLTRVNYTRGNAGRKYIVIHYTGNITDTAKGNANYFRDTDRGASAHYFVDKNAIYQVVSDEDTAWAVGRNFGSNNLFGRCNNNNSISIEMCSDGGRIAPETLQNTIDLTKHLMIKFNIPASNVVRHYDVCSKQCLPIDKTELLTPNGWKNLADIEVGEQVAQFNPHGSEITFGEVQDKVPIHEEETLNFRHLEATADHRMLTKPNCKNSIDYKVRSWGEIFEGTKGHIVPTFGYLDGGLDISDEMLAYIVWVQADGHYMHEKWNGQDNVYGVEFHVKKERKKIRIKKLLNDLDFNYTVCDKKDGSTSYRIYGKEPFLLAEKWLSNKEFTYKLVGMSLRQFNIFWEELLQADGCKSADLYSSTKKNNLDVVQAICATHGKRTSMTTLGSNKKRYGDQPTGILENHFNCTMGLHGNSPAKLTKRITPVSCVTVETGFILIRQDNRTFIVGNCPGWTGWLPPNPVLWNHFKEQIQRDDTTVIAQKGDAEMQCTFEVDNKGITYWFDGKQIHTLSHPDQLVILQKIYEDNNGKAMPHYKWSSKAPWHVRLKQAIDGKAPKKF